MSDLIAERKSINRAATAVAVLTSPVTVLWFLRQGHSIVFSVVMALLVIGAIRGSIDLLFKKLLKDPSLFGIQDEKVRTDDALHRRRLYFWSRKFRLLGFYTAFVTLMTLKRGGGWGHNFTHYATAIFSHVQNPAILIQGIQLVFLFGANFLLFMGPLMMAGISQIKGYEPGDADWGVKLDDVRGQKEAKEEIRKIITLWERGEEFVARGGKRERGILFLGAPGVGKTMLAKAIATGFNCPIVSIPGSGFAQTFIGMDAIIVRFMARKARKLAGKWGGTCLVFIDEIDAVGMRRSSLGQPGRAQPQIPGGMMGGMMGGMAINQLLVVMDGIDNPPFFKKVVSSKINLYLDVLYVIPQKLWKIPLRLPKAKPSGNQIYFIGATNVPLEALDPALTRPGRMGRHIHFRTPTKHDRLDIIDLYLGKVAHVDELDSPEARDELAGSTATYSPADIEQVISIALTNAQHDGRTACNRLDIQEAMVTVEVGMALSWGYESKDEERSTAIHEAGHAVCSYLYKPNDRSTRLSVRRRSQTGGHHSTRPEEERTFKNRLELYYDLVHTLGAYAAEVWFYGHNTQGVGGDLGQASALAATMVGRWGMAPLAEYAGLSAQERKKCERIGKTLLYAAGPGDIQLTREKYADEAALVGQAFVEAYCTVGMNADGIEHIADALVERKEIYGRDLEELLSEAILTKPTIDWSDAVQWPQL